MPAFEADMASPLFHPHLDGLEAGQGERYLESNTTAKSLGSVTDKPQALALRRLGLLLPASNTNVCPNWPSTLQIPRSFHSSIRTEYIYFVH
jgi:hypothetical protein